MSTMIRVSDGTKALLTKLKIHPRETYEDVIKRIVTAHIYKAKKRK